MQWLSTKDNIRADGLSRDVTTAMDTCTYNNMINQNKDAYKYAEEGIMIYKRMRKYMRSGNKNRAICKCERKDRCNDQPLYNKWNNV